MTPRIGALFGIDIRVHIIFPIWVLFQLARHSNDGSLAWGIQIYGTLFGLVLLHEFGHCFAGRAVGGTARNILLWPFGGFAYVETAERPRERLLVTLGGPGVNLAILLILTPFMFWFDQPIRSAFTSWGAGGGNYLADLYAINLDLLVFNMIPAFPLDGGSALLCTLWFRMGQRTATEIAVIVGWVLAGVMIIVAIAAGENVLFFLAIMGIFAGIQERQRVRMMTEQYEAWRGDPAPGGGLRSWWAERKLEKEAKRQERAARDERDRRQRVDELLEKVSREGMNSLTPAERRFLNDMSKHYRDRKK